MESNFSTIVAARFLCWVAFLAITTLFNSCVSSNVAQSKVVQQTEQTAIVQGIGPTIYEAEEDAKIRAKQTFSSYRTIGKECSQEFGYDLSRIFLLIYYSSDGNGDTYWNCAYKISKKQPLELTDFRQMRSLRKSCLPLLTLFIAAILSYNCLSLQGTAPPTAEVRGRGDSLQAAEKEATSQAQYIYGDVPFVKKKRECSKEYNLSGSYWLCIIEVKKGKGSSK